MIKLLTKNKYIMKTTMRILTVLIFLVYVTSIYSQEQLYNADGFRKDYSIPIKGLTIQEIRQAVFGVPAYQVGREVLNREDIPIMRDVVDIRRVATTPHLYIDSLIYEHILDAPSLDFQELLLKRFPYLIMQREWTAKKIMKIMDSLALRKPDITTEEYWYILKTDYAEVVKENFAFMYNVKRFADFYPFRTIGDIRNFRFIINGASSFPMRKSVSIEAKPYMEKLKALPPDSLYFSIPKCSYIITQ